MSEITPEQLDVIKAAKIYVERQGHRVQDYLSTKTNALITAVNFLIESEKPKTCAPPNSTGLSERTFHVLKQGDKAEVFLWNGFFYFKAAQPRHMHATELYRHGYRYVKPVDMG